MGGLSVNDIVDVVLELTPSGAASLSFGVLLICGDSNVISATQRYRSYTSITSVLNDFGATAPEYLAASLFFGQSPQPSTCLIGRWFSTAAAAQNVGGILTSAQQALNLWTSIGNGGFDITIDGSAETLTGLNFTAQTTLNGVASVIQSALTSGQLCAWNGTNFTITSGTTGSGTAASGTATLSGTLTANDTLTINGRTLTFVASSPAAHQVLIGASAAQTAANLQAYLMSAAALADTDLNVCNYSTVYTSSSSAILTITYNAVGTAGNSIAVAKSSTEITLGGLSGGDLSGGLAASSVGYATSPTSSYTDISAQLGLTSTLSQGLVAGQNSETPVACLAVLANLSNAWYGSMFAATVSITDTQHVANAAFIEAQTTKRTYGVTTQETNALVSTVTTDLASLLMQGAYNQTWCQYSSTNAYAIASSFGRAFSVNFLGSNSTICLMFKQEPGVTAETLTESQAATLIAKNCNVFVNYANSTAILQTGCMASGQFFDTIQGIDWLQNYIQTQVYNVLYTSLNKVPQTDAGVNQITNAIGAACGQGVTNGLIGPGTWNGPSFGQLANGQWLKTGFYIYASSIATQSEANRSARQCPPIQVAVKLAGAIQSVNITVLVNQ